MQYKIAVRPGMLIPAYVLGCVGSSELWWGRAELCVWPLALLRGAWWAFLYSLRKKSSTA